VCVCALSYHSACVCVCVCVYVYVCACAYVCVRARRKEILQLGLGFRLVGTVGSKMSGHRLPLQFLEFDPADLGQTDPRPIPISPLLRARRTYASAHDLQTRA
jgi:hypothetical protein